MKSSIASNCDSKFVSDKVLILSLPPYIHKTLDTPVAGHASHVIHLLFFEVIEHGGAGETTVKANHNPGFGKSSTQPRQGSFQDADRSSSGACVAGPEHAGENKLLTLIVELQETQHWQVAVTAVEAVEQAALLRSVGSINRGVKINGDVLDLLTAEAFPVP